MRTLESSIRVTGPRGSIAIVQQTVDPLHESGRAGTIYSMFGLIVEALEDGTFRDFRKVIWTPVQ